MIVSCGEALIDFLPRTATDGTPAYTPFPGGSPFNVAIALGRLGAAAGFFGGLSDDFFGDILRHALAESGVDRTLAIASSRPTTLAFASLDKGNARYAFFDEGSAGRILTDNDLPPMPKAVTALHFGSFSLAEEPCGSALEALMQREHADRAVSLDINVRPTLIHDREGYIARIDRLVAMTDIVKLSNEDLAWLDPASDFDALAARFLDAGAHLVVLTRGGDGALALTRRERVTVPAAPGKVVDTVGAGDTFTAAMLAWLEKEQALAADAIAGLDRDQLGAMLGFAAKAAAITVSRPGCDPPWLRELG